MSTNWDPPPYSDVVSDKSRNNSKQSESSDVEIHHSGNAEATKDDRYQPNNMGYVNTCFDHCQDSSTSSVSSNYVQNKSQCIGKKTLSGSSLMSDSSQNGLPSPYTESVCLKMLGESYDVSSSSLGHNTTLDSDMDASVVTCVAIDDQSSSVVANADNDSVADDVFIIVENEDISTKTGTSQENRNKNVNNNQHIVYTSEKCEPEKVLNGQIKKEHLNSDGTSINLEDKTQSSTSSEDDVKPSKKKLFLSIPVTDSIHINDSLDGNSTYSPKVQELNALNLQHINDQKNVYSTKNPEDMKRRLSYFHYRDQPNRPPRAKDHILLSCLVLACCNPPFGILAFIFSVAVNKKYESGDYDRSLCFSKLSFWVSLLGIAVTVTLTIALLIVYWPESGKHTPEKYTGQTY